MKAMSIVAIDHTFPDLDRGRAAAEANGTHFAPFQCRSATEAAARGSEAALGHLQALVAQDIERALRCETLRRVPRGSQA
jgi:hypothetical protein